MTRVQFELRSPLGPAEVLANLVDFSERRLRQWPAIDPSAYRVHEIGEVWADVTEGSDVFGGIWARERYDWSMPGTVQATVQESNLWQPGGTWTLRAEPDGNGGSRLMVTRDRRAKNLRGRLLEGLMRLAGAKILASQLSEAPALGLVEEPGWASDARPSA